MCIHEHRQTDMTPSPQNWSLETLTNLPTVIQQIMLEPGLPTRCGVYTPALHHLPPASPFLAACKRALRPTSDSVVRQAQGPCVGETVTHCPQPSSC